MQVMKHTVDHTPLQNVLNYLGSRPYNEVAVLVKELMESVASNQPKQSAFPENEPASSDPEPK